MLINLIRKELQLQKINIYAALATGLLWPLDYGVVRHLGQPPISLFPTVQFFLVISTILMFGIPFCWLLILPIMIGASTIAPERESGVWEWALSLPVSRARQWGVKALVAIALLIPVSLLIKPMMDHALIVEYSSADHLPLGEPNQRMQGNAIPPEAWKGLWTGIYPFLFAAIAGYVSSLTRDSFKALLLTVPLIALTFWGEGIIDPMFMLFPLPIGYPSLFIRPWVHYAHLAALAMASLLLAYFNFRFEPVRWKRLILQLTLWIFAVNFFAWFALVGEYYEPELCPRLIPPLGPGSPLTLLLAPPHGGVNGLYRLPKKGELIADVQIGDLRRNQQGLLPPVNERGGSIVEIGVESGRIHQRFNVHGHVSYLDPKGRYYCAQTQRIGDPSYLIAPQLFAWNLGSLTGSYISKLLGIADGSFPVSGSDLTHALVNTGMNSWIFIPVSVESGLYVYSETLPPPKMGPQTGLWNYRESLVRLNPITRKDEIVQQQPQSSSDWFGFYCGTPDGRWYASQLRTMDSIAISQLDDSTSYTLSANGGLLQLAGDVVAEPIQYSVWDLSKPTIIPPLSNLRTKARTMSQSLDGRYLLFYRRFPLDRLNPDRSDFNSVQLDVLDLRAGSEHVLDKVFVPIQNLIPLPPESPKSEFYYPPNSSWSEDHTLAVLLDYRIYFYRPTDDGSGFLSLGMADASRARPEGLEFWNNDLLILWNYNSVWKLDWKKALAKN